MNVDPSGYFVIALPVIGVLGLLGQALIVAALIGAALLGIVGAVYFGRYLGQLLAQSRYKALAASLAILAGYSNAATPLPPNDPRSTGTNTGGSYSLYRKGNIRVEVENMGNNVGHVHLQIKGDIHKYYYNVKSMKFFNEFGNLAPRAVQELLSNKDIVKAIIKGCKILGY
jgi:hypothetical protein